MGLWPGYRWQVTGDRVTGYGLQVTGYRLRVTGYRLQVTGYRLQVREAEYTIGHSSTLILEQAQVKGIGELDHQSSLVGFAQTISEFRE
jgi:hypothetical protein